MVLEKTEYTKGYSIGVGGVVLYKDKALLVRRKRGSRAGDWAIPGGFVERGETIDVAVKREVLEETGVEAQIQGLVAVRSRVINSGDENSAYFIFQLRSTHDNAHADGIEVDEARFFNLQEILELSGLQELTRLVTSKILQGEAQVLTFHAHSTISTEEYIIYA